MVYCLSSKGKCSRIFELPEILPHYNLKDSSKNTQQENIPQKYWRTNKHFIVV
jgi:hypothetical protein